MKADISAGARRLLRALSGAGFEAYLVGGCVRDLLRGAQPHDWDICTSALPEEVKACFAPRPVLETGLKYGTVTVMEGGRPFEVTTYRAEGPYSDHRRPDFVRFVPDLERDLARRDFTMNAIAMDLDGGLRDPFGGADDIRRGLIRCVGEPDRRFREDGLRVMRALRFAAAFGYEIEERTARAIHENRAMLDRTAVERVRAELYKLLAGRWAGDVLRQYPDVLRPLWPQLLPRGRAIRKWLDLLGPEAFFPLLEAIRADHMGQTSDEVRDRLAELDRIRAEAERILAERQCLTRQDLAVDGRDVMAAGINPGPEVGRVLEALLERVRSGETANEREALLEILRVGTARHGSGSTEHGTALSADHTPPHRH